MWTALAALATVGAQVVPQNAHCVIYTDSCGQLLDTLPVCQDFNRQLCNRPACKFVHLHDGSVEVIDNRVTVCRDAAKGACVRPQCKYYHIPVSLPPAPLMAFSASVSSSSPSSASSASSASPATACGNTIQTSASRISNNANVTSSNAVVFAAATINEKTNSNAALALQ
ncbi:muscleblind-like protein 3 [Neodiprion pinetum]|uniref:muscleblind-like protein 3 n=1 Tax=Neodiprion pinetum TaxID=441929 RepID=UPI00076FC502